MTSGRRRPFLREVGGRRGGRGEVAVDGSAAVGAEDAGVVDGGVGVHAVGHRQLLGRVV